VKRNKKQPRGRWVHAERNTLGRHAATRKSEDDTTKDVVKVLRKEEAIQEPTVA
jgi:predicted RNA-binding protein YlxR (DUF448 family)